LTGAPNKNSVTFGDAHIARIVSKHFSIRLSVTGMTILRALVFYIYINAALGRECSFQCASSFGCFYRASRSAEATHPPTNRRIRPRRGHSNLGSTLKSALPPNSPITTVGIVFCTPCPQIIDNHTEKRLNIKLRDGP
jgi:hypothetical protein